MSKWTVSMQVKLEVDADTEEEASQIAEDQAKFAGDMDVIAINNIQSQAGAP